MAQIKVTKAPIEGLYVIEPAVHGDSRGYFMETYNQNDMHEFGLDMVCLLYTSQCGSGRCHHRCAAHVDTIGG